MIGITSILTYAMIGMSAGFLSGMMGIGGGVIIVPAMTMLIGMSQKEAQGLSLAVIVPMALFSFLRYRHMGFVQIDIKTTIVLVVAAVIGAQIGTTLMSGMSNKSLQLMFGIFVIITGAAIVIKATR